MLEYKQNPIFSHLTGREVSPVQFVNRWLGTVVIIGIFVLILFALTFNDSPFILGNVIDVIKLFLLLLAWLSTMLMPIVIAPIAVLATHNAVNNDLYRLVRLTTLSNSRILEGILATVLYKSRYGIGMIIGLMPAIILDTLASQIDRINCNIGSQIPCVTNPIEPSMLLWAGWLLMVIQRGISLLGLSFLIASLGLYFTLWWRTRFVGIVVLIISVIFLGFTSNFFDSLISPRQLPVTGINLLLTTTLMLFPYILGTCLIVFSTHLVRVDR